MCPDISLVLLLVTQYLLSPFHHLPSPSTFHFYDPRVTSLEGREPPSSIAKFTLSLAAQARQSYNHKFQFVAYVGIELISGRGEQRLTTTDLE